MTDQINNSSKKSGMAAREGALRLIHAVLSEKQLLDDAYRTEITQGALRRCNGNDRAFAKRIATTLLQHLGEIDEILNRFMDRGIPRKSGPLRNILRIGVAELLFLDNPAHAVVDCAVTHYRTWRKYAGFKGLTNAVLRRVSQNGKKELASINAASSNLPDWIYQSWCKQYGSDAVESMMVQFQKPQIPLDLTVKQNSDQTHWVKQLDAQVTPAGNLRLASHDRVDRLAGFLEGAWWVQDAAATFPVLMMGDVTDREVLDLCAAPGGKTMQLASKGAKVTALDMSGKRLDRVQENLDRTGLQAELVRGNVLEFDPGRSWPFVLLDAPCSATGTIRRHPEILHQRTRKDVEHFSSLQTRMLDRATRFVAPGGMLLFCTCSLQPEEGPGLIADFLMNNPEFGIEPLEDGEIEGLDLFIQPDGSLRTRPDQWADIGGLDGFYAVRFRNHAE